MKRRNVAEGKIARRPLKRSKITDNFYGSSLVYMKLLLLWGSVLLADYLLEFRFEYLWPFWLFLRSVYDSFKYQGMAFSVFFIFIALTSDLVTFLFIPVHWLFFAASTYVWVQYVWHTEKGICVPTVFLWLLFVYIEASIRLKEFGANIDLKHLPFHLDLCRPFAAHCIGYPVVTLGFGFKSYVGYRMRQRRQREVQKDNEYYYEFCREALPPGPVREDAFNPHPSPKICEDRISADGGGTSTGNGGGTVIQSSSSSSTPMGPLFNGVFDSSSKKSLENGVVGSIHYGNGTGVKELTELNGSASNSLSLTSAFRSSSSKVINNGGIDSSSSAAAGGGGSSLTCHDHDNGSTDLPEINGGHGNSSGKKSSKSNVSSSGIRDASRKNRDTSKLSSEDQKTRMETDIKRLKCDLQISRNKENELRDQIITFMSSERTLKSEISTLQVEKSVLESKVSSLLSTRAGEKATLSNLEKCLANERKQKADFQTKLESERKSKKDADKAEKVAQQNQTRNEVAKLESELNKVRLDLYNYQERCTKAEQEVFVLRKYKDTHGDPEILVNAVKTMQDKNSVLEKSLSAETKLKMDLFSALGEAKRDLSIKQSTIVKLDNEISDLKAKIAEVLAVMPTTSTNSVMPSFTATSNALTLDLPHSTELSFSSSGSGSGSKMSALGLSNLDDKFSALDPTVNSTANSVGGLYTPASLSGSAYTPKTNGTVNDSQ